MTSSWLKKILVISRPRFWVYEVGTLVLGMFAGGLTSEHLFEPAVLGSLLFFLIPANILIYGINDIYDYETDRLNAKKVEYEALLYPKDHPVVWKWIVGTCTPFLLLFFFVSWPAALSLVLFVFFATFYSAKPIRAKIRPGLDSFFSASHYVVTGVYGYFLVGGQGFPIMGIVAGLLWSMAMHAYSAVPDIIADKQSGIETIATRLGARATIVWSAVFYVVAGGLAAVSVGKWLVPFTLIYLGLMYLSFKNVTSHQKLLRIYAWFPRINLLVGFLVTAAFVLRLPEISRLIF